MTSITPWCLSCKYVYKDSLKCEAFPKGIPMKILTDNSKHTSVVDGQEGDYVFSEGEPKSEPKSGKSGKEGW